MLRLVQLLESCVKLGEVSDLVARDFVCNNYSSELRMLVIEDERVTPVYLISLLGSASHYERNG
ncbi:hypothetical protein F511_34538 [Dorcoceras hygrometricum]|uniref:Uncharacterized protein n=1 Tax=Dorcoceras hygrometricum TaxID=472368 RepID=A0A2Z7BWL7_9LAMI|nr:hypothetical protein F511_34538 [Dorcoceras hygrometricum]